MQKVAVVGVGETKFTGTQTQSNMELFSQAAMDAINEANLKPKDIQAVLVGNALSGFEEKQQMVQAFITENIGAFNVATNIYDGACASSTVVIRDAFIWIASGLYDVVLAGGTDRAATMGTKYGTEVYSMYSDRYYEYPSGITFPGIFAMITYLYADRYHIPIQKLKEQMALATVKAHKYGMFNPKAHLHREMTVERVLKSNTVCQPLQVYDCCPFSDGAAAVVLASERIARKLTDKPVFITGVGQASAGSLASQQDYLPRLIARELAAKQAYEMAGIGPADIDVCELHDSFSICEILAIEGLGFFENGKGGDATERGETMLGGKVVVNPSGGLKAKGHPVGATGAGQVYEIVRQLRNEGGEVQVEGAETGMTDNMGAGGSIQCNLILQKGWSG